jgi:hypothetical protein
MNVRLRIAAVACCLLLTTPGQAQEIQVIRADGPPVWGDDGRLVEETRIGSLSGAPEYVFGSVGGVVQLNDGSVWVGDTHLHAIRVYATDGEYLRQIGREGEGPGEFEYPSSMRLLPDGSVVVWDPGLRRVSRLNAAGDFLDSFTPRTVQISMPTEEFEVDREGNLYLIAREFSDYSQIDQSTAKGRLQAARAALGIGTPWFWFKLRPDGEILDSIYLEPFEDGAHADPEFTFTALSPLGYRVVARNDEYAVELRRSGSDVVRIERSWEQIAYEREERQEKQRLADAAARNSGRPAGRVPEHKPPFSGLWLDVDGRIWVRLHQPGYRVPEDATRRAEREQACRFFGASKAECDQRLREWYESLVYEVIEPSGQYLGRLELPHRDVEMKQAPGRILWVVGKGELGEPYVVRYRIEPGN